MRALCTLHKSRSRRKEEVRQLPPRSPPTLTAASASFTLATTSSLRCNGCCRGGRRAEGNRARSRRRARIAEAQARPCGGRQRPSKRSTCLPAPPWVTHLGQLPLMILAVHVEQLCRHLRGRGKCAAAGCGSAVRRPAPLPNPRPPLTPAPRTANLRTASPSVSSRSRSEDWRAERAVMAHDTSSRDGDLRTGAQGGGGAVRQGIADMGAGGSRPATAVSLPHPPALKLWAAARTGLAAGRRASAG